MGKVVAPLCRKWIGCDVASNMLSLTAQRLKDLSNVELVELSGYDSTGVADTSVDVVYCTVVFMHLESWDGYNYIVEAFRVLRPRGRIYVDNINLCSDGGWKVFETHRTFSPANRPPHMTQNSTPQEIETYLKHAGFLRCGWFGRRLDPSFGCEARGSSITRSYVCCIHYPSRLHVETCRSGVGLLW